MKTIGLVIMSMCLTTLLFSQETIELTVDMAGISSDKGKVYVGLYDSEKNWLEETVKGEISEIKNGNATVIFKDIPKGLYGVSAYHDENNNEKMDTNMFGIPSEDYACSRQAKGMFGPPSWEDAVIDIKSNNRIEIKF